MSDRDFLRSLTLGSPQRQFRRKLVVIRDASKPRQQEVELDLEGAAVMEPVLDAADKQVFDDAGAPVMREKKRYRHPPLIAEDGKQRHLEVREPSLKQRAAIFRAAGITAANAQKDGFDQAQLQVEAVVALTYEPGTNVKIFDEKDRPSLLAQPAGGFVDDLYDVISPLMNLESEETTAKNSKGTVSA